MLIRIGSVEDMKGLWSNINSPTAKYFIKGIEEGNIEFWTVEDEKDKALIGELYIFWNSEDKDEANGKNRAYLCAFRIEDEFSGHELGSELMKRG